MDMSFISKRLMMVDIIHSQLTLRGAPNLNMEDRGVNEENTEPWVENKKSGSENCLYVH